jgi:hypothetical protein
MASTLSVRHRAYFRSELMNRMTQQYESTLLKSLIQHHVLTTAKGSSQFADLTDSPYHIHILNGLYPALLLLEQQLERDGRLNLPEIEPFLKCLIVGFTFHDLNKLVDVEPLEKAVKERLEQQAELLNVADFLPEWRYYLPEIGFLALGAENRTGTWAFSRQIREWHFVNETLRPTSHFADSLASIDNFGSVDEFYEQVYAKIQNVHGGSEWTLSYVEVHDNIYALLSQKMLNLAKSIIQAERKQQILFNLRNGFVYFGEPLTAGEVQSIKQRFSGEEAELNPVALTKIDHQSCKFGFIESTQLTLEILESVIREKLNDLLKTAKDVNESGQREQRQAVLRGLLDAYELPLVLRPVKENSADLRIYPRAEWAELKDDHALLTLFALQKIKFLSGRICPQWRQEFEKWRDEETPFCEGRFDYQLNGQRIPVPNSAELLALFGTDNTRCTVAALISACEKRIGADDSSDVAAQTFDEVINTFNKTFGWIADDQSKPARSRVIELFDKFVDLYLSGNFVRDINQLMQGEMTIPEKKNMCIFCSKPATEDYGSEKSFGIKALGFNNRTVNTLKNKTSRMCGLCASELRMRKSLFTEGSKANSAVYYDFGEYLFSVDTPSLLTTLAAAFGIDVEERKRQFTVTLDNRAFNYNLYHLNFESIDDSVKGNFDFIHQTLKLIRRTGFRLFVASVISPYHQHREIFVFDNCMPFVKQLGWDRIRIDEVGKRLEETNLFYTLGSNLLSSNVLSYAEDRRAIFSAFYRLDEDRRKEARGIIVRFIKSHWEELDMNVIEKLVDNAVKIDWSDVLHSISGNAESWMFRDSLDILKICVKEGCDRTTTIEQIAGGLHKTFRGKRRDNKPIPPSERLMAFAATLYDDLFVGQWRERVPQPGRLKHWINQFSLCYRMKAQEEGNKFQIEKAIERLTAENQPVTEDAVIAAVITDRNRKYEEEYRECFRKYFQNETEEAQP